MICTIFNSNIGSAIVYCNCPPSANDKTDTSILYNDLFTFGTHIPQNKVLIINGEMNTQIGKGGRIKFCKHKTANENDEYLAEFSLENKLACLNSKLQKSKGKR